MAHHKAAKKSIRQSAKRNARNRKQGKHTRSVIKAIRIGTDKAEAEKQMPAVMSKIDRLAKSNVIHKNKAANLKSGLMKKIAAMK
ncbi:MAG: 30S ribosomal protein S20 [Fimbriimonadaceae bacterium]|nr:30S ribosomal protein S20 [Chitinophagales bacterium]